MVGGRYKKGVFKGQSLKKIGPLPYQVPSTKSQIYNNKETTTISTWYYTWVTSNPDEPAVYVSHKKFLLSSIYIIQSRLGSGEQKRKNRFLNLERGAPSMLYTHGGYLENKGGHYCIEYMLHSTDTGYSTQQIPIKERRCFI